ncbi:MAG TPA: RNase adapter RapZ [Williamwhitmania sp.]|nr:RNase adapter RapZ [Williamwhitmania sp.]
MALPQLDIINALALSHFGVNPTCVVPLAFSGSNRRYFRIEVSGKTFIAVVGDDIEENKTFLYLTQHFAAKGIAVPKIEAVSKDQSAYILEDLGKQDLFSIITDSEVEVATKTSLLKRALEKLVDIQIDGAEGLDFMRCYPQPSFDATTVMWDLNYFKYCFLKPSGIYFNESLLENDFLWLAQTLATSEGNYFQYRDFQSRNIMVRDSGELVFIDYQGGRRGPLLYDAASFIYQAKAGLSEKLKTELFEHYLEVLSAKVAIDKASYRERFKLFVLFRTLQVLGAYGFRGYFEHKPHFLQSIPFAIKNLNEMLRQQLLEGTYLAEVLSNLTLKEFGGEQLAAFNGLTVEVWSFSYRRGVPDDLSGNGGGFVFDCRAVYNPGRSPELGSLTGRDKEVVAFIESSSEMENFLDGANQLANKSVERYLERGFTNLMLSFGCTGGQHRSVYAAEAMAHKIKSHYPEVRVVLHHRELGIIETM